MLYSNLFLPSMHDLLPVCLYIQIFLLDGHWSLDLGLNPIQDDLILTWLHLQRPYFHKVTLMGVKHLCVCCRFSCVRLSATSCTVALQAPLSMGFSRPEYWSGFPCPPPPGDLPHPGTEPVSLSLLHWQMGSLPPVPTGQPRCQVGRNFWEH